jgi:glucosamine--fructose-6-phosphate aminotransferase (isomerizing)
MCGIVGAIAADRNVVPILLEGLRRLEYRGYDSAGLAVVGDGGLHRVRTLGKVAQLAAALENRPLAGRTGIAHTRWATHGVPSERNAHPHLGGDTIAVVHNGIIENHQALREELRTLGVECASDTDSEVIAQWIAVERARRESLLEAVRAVIERLDGTFALGVVDAASPGEVVGARRGSPLVIGVGVGERYLASDLNALLPVTQRVVYLEDGDLVRLRADEHVVWDHGGRRVERPVREATLGVRAAERGPYRHFMAKEIFEQPAAIAETLEGRLVGDGVPDEIFGPDAADWLGTVRNVEIVACGTSYHAGLVARYWMEAIAGIPCHVEVASEYRYRRRARLDGNLLITVSQSGETADTLAALRKAREEARFLRSLCICNVPESSLVRESDGALMTHAGPEIGVASTKAFTTQLVALLLVVIVLARRLGRLDAAREAALVALLRHLPARVDAALALDEPIRRWAD